MTCSLASCLNAAPETRYSLCTSYKKKLYAINTIQYMPFVNLEKAFFRVPRRVICWALCKLDAEEWPVRLIQSMYKRQKQSACWMQPEGRVHCESECSRRLLPEPPTVHHGSGSPLTGKTCVQMTWASSLNRWRNCKRSWSSGRPT